MNSGEAVTVPAAGILAETSFPELLRRLSLHGFTGTLTLRRQGVTKVTYFQDGRLVFARSSDPNDRLGEFLVRRGVIKVGEYLESAARIAPGSRQGAILCDMGAIAAEDLVRCVKDQVSEILFTQFDWSEGSWEIAAGAEQEGGVLDLNIPVEELILVGARRVADWRRIWSGIGGSLEARLAPTPLGRSLSWRASLNDDEAHLLALVSGRLSVGRILELGYGSHFETCRTLWAFRVLGAIRPAGEEAGPEDGGEDWDLAELVERYDRALSLVHGFVLERIGDLVDHFVDRALGEAAGRHPEVLAGLHLRNQGRVEYEDVYARLVSEPPERRRERVSAALADVIRVLLELASRELGREEAEALREDLLQLGRELPDLRLEEVLRRGGG